MPSTTAPYVKDIQMMGPAVLEEKAKWIGWEWRIASASYAQSYIELVFQWTGQYYLLSY
jgi:hypothetical protein